MSIACPRALPAISPRRISCLSAAVALSATLTAPVHAILVNPVVVAGTESTAAVTAGVTPQFGFALGAQIDPLSSAAADSATDDVLNAAADTTDTTDGSAHATLDNTDINLSTVGARSTVTTGAGGSDSPVPNPPTRSLANFSIGGFGATLSTTGLAPGDTGEVDLTLNVDGTLTYVDPAATAGMNVEIQDPFGGPSTFVSDISGSVSVLMALSDQLPTLASPVVPDLTSLSFTPLFNGSLVIESSAGAGTAPTITAIGDFQVGDFTVQPGCDGMFCQVDVLLSRTFNDVQSLGFGENFDLGLLMFTEAQIAPEAGRSLDIDFANTASVDVALTAVPGTSVPEPATLGLLAAALGLTGWARRKERRA